MLLWLLIVSKELACRDDEQSLLPLSCIAPPALSEEDMPYRFVIEEDIVCTALPILSEEDMPCRLVIEEDIILQK